MQGKLVDHNPRLLPLSGTAFMFLTRFWIPKLQRTVADGPRMESVRFPSSHLALRVGGNPSRAKISRKKVQLNSRSAQMLPRRLTIFFIDTKYIILICKKLEVIRQSHLGELLALVWLLL